MVAFRLNLVTWRNDRSAAEVVDYNVKMYGVVAAINQSHLVSNLNKFRYEYKRFKKRAAMHYT